jgi:oligopeptide/dipeptide ABC transporter ATP-binding protein
MTPNESDSVVSVRGLNVTFTSKGWGRSRSVPAVQGVDLDIRPGTTLGVAGESGSGKSTIARALMRVSPIRSGSVRVGGTDVVALSGRRLKRFRRYMQMVFQDPYDSLNPRMTVGDAVGEALGVSGVARADQKAGVQQLFERVGLPASFADRYPNQLSGGQRQRVSIARALAVDPRVIICDEAVSALDVSVRAQILNLLKDLRDAQALSYLFISHDLSTLRFIADDVAIMYFGRIVEIGTREQVFASPAHPYTRALFAAIPEPGTARVRPRSRMAGEPPSHADPPTGCSFHPRCPRAQEICSTTRPELTVVPGGQRAACHFPQQGPVQLDMPGVRRSARPIGGAQ